MRTNNAYSYQPLDREEPPPLAAEVVSSEKAAETRGTPPSHGHAPQVPFVRVHEVRAVVVPKLEPDNVAGICCPVGTIYNHEHPGSLLRRFLFAFELTLHFVLAFAQVGRWLALQDFIENYDQAVRQSGYSPHREQDFLHDVETGAYMTDCQATMFATVVVMWLLWNVFTRIVFFCCYKPRSVYDASTRTFVLYKPNWIAKLFFPLSTVYYHEENQLVTLKTVLAYFLGCFYSLCCFKPKWQKDHERRQQERTFVQVYTV